MKSKLLASVYSPDDFKKKGQQIIIELADHLKNTTTGENAKTINWNEPENELDFWRNFLKKGNEKDLFSETLKRSIHVHHPKYIGHQIAATAPITVLTSLISAMFNNGMAVYEMGMSSTAMERIVTDHLCQKIGWDSNARGLLTSGGTLANLTALLAARKAKVSHDVWNEGNIKPLGIMVSEEAHYCVDRAAKIMGLGEKGIIKIPANDGYALDTSQLETSYREAKAKGIEVFAIVGSAPSTATGIYDDLKAIGNFVKQHDLWFHVDGAHGGAAIYSRKYKHLLNGMEEADSVVIDGHKMMLMPALTTALLFKNGMDSHATFSQKADYLLNDTDHEDWYNGGKRTFECTKTMMSLHWYALLKCYGEALFDEFVTRQYDLARELAQLLLNDANFEIAITPQSNILCFRYVDSSLVNDELNSLNAQIRAQLLADGEFYLVQTKLRGNHYLRTSLMNPFTTTDQFKKLLVKIKKTAHSVLLKKN
ncbi:pyridoxal phosphate-dependent decarboxylase family protein [Maribacter sp. 2304DJ31-5]|uniref:pyridoxal phosphate-dependent decarboxylase family protein n=1 Tax=Maribacter sp. 2304DJ31-5 TaxID=3386273 RepID=UPI0039BD5675